MTRSASLWLLRFRPDPIGERAAHADSRVKDLNDYAQICKENWSNALCLFAGTLPSGTVGRF